MQRRSVTTVFRAAMSAAGGGPPITDERGAGLRAFDGSRSTAPRPRVMLVSVTDEPASLTASVIDWLNSSGATVELFAARTLSARGLEVNQGLYLPDPETPETAREIDVIGARRVQLVDVGVIAAYLVIECKYTLKPWVIVRGRPEYESSVPNFDRITTRFGRQWLDRARTVPAINEGRTFAQEPRPGHALVTAHIPDEQASGGSSKANKNNQDSAYAAIMSAVHEEFVRWFGADVAGPAERYDEIAREIWQLRRTR
jgi:hypothetical protein